MKAESPAVTSAPFGSISTVNLPAAQNFEPAFFKTLQRLKIDVVVVIFRDLKKNHPLFQHAGIEEHLGNELHKSKAGNCDSVFHHPGERWIVFHATNLAKCVSVLKAGLEARELLQQAQIAVAESSDVLVVWCPPTAERILCPE